MAPRKTVTAVAEPQTARGAPIDGGSIDVAPSFVELKAWLVPVGDAFELYATFRVHMMEFEHRDRLIEVRTARASLVLALDGLAIDERSPRFAVLELEAEHRSTTTTKTVSEAKVSGKTSVKGVLSPVAAFGSASAEGAVEGRVSSKTVGTEVSETVLRRVVARPGNRWDFCEPGSASLEGDYLNGRKLCTLTRKAGANRLLVRGSLYVRRDDLRFHHCDPGWLDGLERNKRKLLDVYLSTVLADRAFEVVGGRLALCTVEIEP